MKNVEVSYVFLQAKPGVAIGDVKMEALKLALDEQRNVRYKHNTTTREICIKDLYEFPDKEISG